VLGLQASVELISSNLPKPPLGIPNEIQLLGVVIQLVFGCEEHENLRLVCKR
jgi:hypothetical protein